MCDLAVITKGVDLSGFKQLSSYDVCNRFSIYGSAQAFKPKSPTQGWTRGTMIEKKISENVVFSPGQLS